MLRRLAIGIALVLMPVAAAKAAAPVYIAIIIDDVGYNLARGMRAIALPGPVTISILPFTDHSRRFAIEAHRQDKEVMIHMPMANLAHLPLGPEGLDGSLTMREFLARLANAVSRVPYARGINNHMGSYLTQQTAEMTWLMDDLARRDLYFIDSRTTDRTVALKIARRKHLLSSRRDVFLDNVQDFDQIDRAFEHLISIARRKGSAIAIAHPHDATLTYLETILPLTGEDGIILLPASKVLAKQRTQRLAEMGSE